MQTKLDEIEGYKDHNIDGGNLKLVGVGDDDDDVGGFMPIWDGE